MSERVRVLHDDDGRLVAVKAPPPSDPQRVHREASVLEAVGHPGVVELVGVHVSSDGPELWTRWVGSRSAADLPRPLPPARAAGLVLAVGRTLADLHRMGFVHGAVDPSHVLLDPLGRPVLCGWGRAAALGTPLGPASGDDLGGDLLARPSVDVAGLGGLLLDLLQDADQGPGRSRGGARRGPRKHSAQVRALRSVAAQATVPDPRDRLGLRALLDGVRHAVPDAALEDDDHPTRGPGGSPTARDGDHPADLPQAGRRADDPIAALLRDVVAAPGAADDAGPTDEVAADGPPRWPDPAPVAPARDVRIDAPRASEGTEPVLDEMARLRPLDDDDPKGRSVRRLGMGAGALALATVSFLGLSSLSEPSTPDAPRAPAASFAPPTTPAPATAPGSTTTSPTTSTTAPPTEGERPRGPVVVHEGRRFQVGEPGDLAVVGDWRCDDRTTVALYRPTTGAVFVFSSWPRPGERAETTAVVVSPGGTTLETGLGADGCPTLHVRGDAGTLVTLTAEDLR
jgi:hypothetical protein